MSFSVIVFIPLDIYLNEEYTNVDEDTGLERAFLYDWWAISYWSSYLLNWVLIPLLQGYVTAGEFGISDKIYRSIVSSVPFYLLYCLGFIGLLFVIFIIDN